MDFGYAISTLVELGIVGMGLLYFWRRKRQREERLAEQKVLIMKLLLEKCLELSNEEDYLRMVGTYSKDELVRIEALRFIRDCMLDQKDKERFNLKILGRLHRSVTKEIPELEKMLNEAIRNSNLYYY